MKSYLAWMRWSAACLALLADCTSCSDDAARNSSTHRPDGGSDAADAKSATADSCSPGMRDGGYTIETDQDVAAIASCTEFGALTITGNELTAVSLPRLKKMGGSLGIIKTSVLTNLSLPSLEQIDGFLQIDENAALTTLRLGALVSVLNSFAVDHNPALIDFDLGALSKSGFLTIGYNDTITDFTLPAGRKMFHSEHVP